MGPDSWKDESPVTGLRLDLHVYHRLGKCCIVLHCHQRQWKLWVVFGSARGPGVVAVPVVDSGVWRRTKELHLTWTGQAETGVSMLIPTGV